MVTVAHSNAYASSASLASKPHSWKNYVWCVYSRPEAGSTCDIFYRDTWNKPAEERKFLARLDACLITYAALSYFSKYLDQQNITVSLFNLRLRRDIDHHSERVCLRDARRVRSPRLSYKLCIC